MFDQRDKYLSSLVFCHTPDHVPQQLIYNLQHEGCVSLATPSYSCFSFFVVTLYLSLCSAASSTALTNTV